jgi:uncharacterized membrane protein (GlpM family)
MTFAEGVIRFIAGGTLVLLIGIVAKNGKSTIAGIIALFPVITAVSFTFLARSADIKIVKDTVLSGIFSLPATLIFLIVFYICAGKVSLLNTLVISLLSWGVGAAVIYFIKA